MIVWKKREKWSAMRKYIILLACVCLICGCSAQKNATKKLRDIEFTVVKDEEVPQELASMIAEKKKERMKLVYTDEAYLYIVEGYGTKPTSGYSVMADACYETENTVCFHSQLLGPKEGEKIFETESYPYVVIKIEKIEKHIVFQ